MKSGGQNYIDAHIHVDLYPSGERDAMLKRAFDQGITAVVAVSMHLESCKINRELAMKYPGRLIPAYGFHPEQILPSGSQLEELMGWIRDRNKAGETFAIGEVGLPYYTRLEAREAGRPFDEGPYLQVLDQFAALAAELDRPLVLHAVYEDADKACDILDKHQVRRAHFHWFKGSSATLGRIRAAGFRISVTPDVEYEEEIRQIVKDYPIELMMTETDGPWPFEGTFAGKCTRPEMVREVAAEIALIKGIQEDHAASRLLDNAKEFYR
ncbi:TatD family hydrolase [Paenibacillus nasutitermitis]|uniref:Uncharacterized protein n=1 Tax=Paenibacillus nasutitermitis TaxID=1652958 RepID=A0A916YZL0_9BACL|nr:TatD family hydrolase [Paenibacillus nasutitermitis]GGD68815.1 hypothetical protein GCM10010911_28260 [Paenibacillus nasutitermitis]